MKYTKNTFRNNLINYNYSITRDQTTFSIGMTEMNKSGLDTTITKDFELEGVTGKPDYRDMSDIIIYLMGVEQEQLVKNGDKLNDHNGYFIRNNTQFRRETNILSYKVINKCLKELKDLGLIDYTSKGNLNGVNSFKIYTDKVIDLVNSYNDQFERYQTISREVEIERSENIVRTHNEHLNNIKIKNEHNWSVINKNKYLPMFDLKNIMEPMGYDDLDVMLVSFISKGYWKFKNKVIKWSEFDLNLIRGCVSTELRGDKTRKEQSDLFWNKYGNLQKVIDCCSFDDTKVEVNRNWSYKYRHLYLSCLYSLRQNLETREYRYKYFELSEEDKDYFIERNLSEEVILN